MPKPQSQTYKSIPQTHVASSVMRFPPWVPQTGPKGGRNIIDSLELVYNFTDISLATTACEGEDVWRAIESLVVEQVDGVQRYQGIQGDALRIFCYQAMGADQVPEFADIAVANNQSLTFAFPVPFTKRYAKRGKDFGLPAELLKEIRVGCALAGASTGMSVAGGTSTIAAANMYILAHCHEEFSVERKVVDQVAVSAFQTSTVLTAKIGGRLHDLIIYQRAAVGGGSVTGLTELRIDGILPDPLLRTPDLKFPYLRDHGAALNDANAADGAAVRNDPVGNDRAVSVLWPGEGTSSYAGPLVDDLTVRITSGSLSSALAITRAVLPPNPQLTAAVNAKHGHTDASYRVKTAGKTKRQPVQWQGEGDKLAFLPLSAPLKRTGLRQG